MQVKPGTRLRSSVCATEVVVVRAPSTEIDLRCGGHPMVAAGGAPAAGATVDAEHRDGTQMGKRYADPDVGLEVLSTKGGEGSLSLGSASLHLKDAKALPSSD